MRPALSRQINKLALLADRALLARTLSVDFRALIRPNIPGEQGAAQLVFRSEQDFDGFGRLYGRCQVDRRIQNPARSERQAAPHPALLRSEEHTSELQSHLNLV